MELKKGFTLIELLVVVSIIGILASVVLISLNSARAKARDAQRLSDVHQIKTALELYYTNHGYYPQQTVVAAECNSPSALSILVSENALPKVPIDPINKESPLPRFCYHYTGIGAASSYAYDSSWYCSGRRRTDYQYAFLFSTESTTANYPRLTDYTGTPNGEYLYCVAGPLR